LKDKLTIQGNEEWKDFQKSSTEEMTKMFNQMTATVSKNVCVSIGDKVDKKIQKLQNTRSKQIAMKNSSSLKPSRSNIVTRSQLEPLKENEETLSNMEEDNTEEEEIIDKYYPVENIELHAAK
jgi:hypothetical protein